MQKKLILELLSQGYEQSKTDGSVWVQDSHTPIVLRDAEGEWYTSDV